MADWFDTQASFTNPSYASPEQRASARAYADALTKRSTEGVTRPTGVLAAMIDSLTAGLTRNNANRQEGGMYDQAVGADSALARALIGGGQGGQPAAIPSMPGQPSGAPPAAAGPMATPSGPKVWGDQEAVAAGLYPPPSGPAGGGSVTPGAPGTPSPLPAGVPAQPPMSQQQIPLRPAEPPMSTILAQQLNNPMVPAEQKAMIRQLMNPTAGQDVTGQATLNSPLGGQRLQPTGPGVVQGRIAPVSDTGTNIVIPAGGGNAGAAGLDAGIDTMNRLKMNAAGSGAVADFKKADLTAANDAPTIKRVAGVMLNDLQTHGDKMTFGPTAAWSNDAKRAAANYAPGLMKDQMESLASADSFDKMSAQLTSILGRGGGTDAQLFNNMKSVPGSHNSKEGAEALLKMTLQVADQQQALRQATAGAQTPEQYTALKDQFYARNPIINPITNNPIKLDLEKQGQQSGGIVSVSTPQEASKLPKGTHFKTPDGTIRVVP